MTGDDQSSPAIPRWLRAIERDPGATDLVALVRALERFSGSRLGDRADGDDGDDDGLDLRLRAEPRLSTAAGRRLQVKTSVDADGAPAHPARTGPYHQPPPDRPPPAPDRPYSDRPAPDRPTIEIILRGYGSLVGPTTPLPLPLAERASGPGAGSERLRAFLDLFHHRLFTHLVGGLARLQAPQASADADLWEVYLLSAAGLRSPSSAIPRSSRRQLLPLLLSASGRPTPALLDQALEICLRPLAGAGLRAHTQALSQTKAPRPRSTLSHLGSPRARLQTASSGGQDAPLLLGAQLSVRHGLTIELHLAAGEPLDAFSQDQAGHRIVRELVELLAPPGTRWELNLHPIAHIPHIARRQARLGSARLGRTRLRGSTASAPLRVWGAD